MTPGEVAKARCRAGCEQYRGRKETEGGEQERGDLRSVLVLTFKPCIYTDPSNEIDTPLLTGNRN